MKSDLYYEIKPILNQCRQQLLETFGEEIEFSVKEEPRSVSIDAERVCEGRIREALLKMDQQSGFWGEETGSLHGSSRHLWVVDPLCGTLNYIRGIPEFAIGISLMENDKCIFSAVCLPCESLSVFSEHGKGVWLDSTGLAEMTRRQTVHLPVVAVGQRLISGEDNSTTRSIFGEAWRLRVASSANMELAYLAMGRIDAYANVDQHSYDFLPGILFAEELGLVCAIGGSWEGDHVVTSQAERILISNPLIYEHINTVLGWQSK